jgi:hypothetical protein
LSKFFFEQCDIDIGEITSSAESLTFLVGAGISMEPPSNLASGQEIVKAIIQYGTSKDAIDKISNLDLRYEHIIELFRDHFDPDLKILEYYEETNEYNVLHRFLAKMIREGQYVMTTNFDYLIEAAVGLNDPNLEVVISQTDFDKFSDMELIKNKEILPVYKIHGSLQNPKTGDDTRNSILSTIDSFGKSKEGEIFFVESFKRRLFEEVCNDRTLIVMGYSGGDDFDILPTLFHMKGIKRIIWISHSSEKDQKMETYHLEEKSNLPKDIANGNQIKDELFSKIKSELDSVDVYKVVAHTGKLVSLLMGEKYKQSKIPWKNDALQWLIDKFPDISEEDKCFFTGNIFYNYGEYDEAIIFYNNFIKLTNAYEDLKHLY